MVGGVEKGGKENEMFYQYIQNGSVKLSEAW